MYELIYRNLETGILVKEYRFANFGEKRRLFLEENNNYEVVSCKRFKYTMFSRIWWRYYWKCAMGETWDITPKKVEEKG